MSGTNYGITVLYPPKDEEEPRILFDLVAIHGLNGDSIETWTHRESRVMWLRDLLPGELPHFRVMTFGYNARFKNFTAQQDLRSIASKLLSELVDLRDNEMVSNEKQMMQCPSADISEARKRPIVFVCHSLGGIVAKKALLIGCPEEEQRIQESVCGILFLGTPHNGSSLAKMGKLVTYIVAACTPMNPARGFINLLQKDSEELFYITTDFVKRRKNLRIISFFEMEETRIAPLWKRFVVEHHSAILNLPEEVTIGQYSDHREIARFKSVHDRNFRPILAKLKRFEEAIDLKNDSQRSSEQNAHTVLLDIPIGLCHSFRGRDDILEKMYMHFYIEDDKMHQRKTFTICGLGGTGKTQTALQFLVQNANKYTTGVMFLNASSIASLEASFSRLHNLLQLNDTNDKVTSVKAFLSKRENSRWIMLFDNADDVHATPILRYFPVINSGHIIVTSCDQSLIGHVTEDGCVLGPLDTLEARAILLERSGIKTPSNSDLQNATEIVNLLGSLPLAVSHAGAFMRSRYKSPQEYKVLYLKAQRELLGYIPRLFDSEKSILLTWELNFRQVEQESSDARDILLLFCFLAPSKISEILLHRGSSPQRRWGDNGEVTEVSAEAEGLDPSLAKLIQDEIIFDNAIETLKRFSFVDIVRDDDGRRYFSVHPLVQYCATERIPVTTANKWRWQAILLVCHAFPRNAYLEPLNGDIGRDTLPQLVRILSELDKMSLIQPETSAYEREIAAALLAASRFSDSLWKIEAVSRAKLLLKNNPDHHMEAWLTYRESSVLRMSGQYDESERVLEKFVKNIQISTHSLEVEKTSRYNAQRGDLIISFAENLVRKEKLQEAKINLNEWQPLIPEVPSALERITLRARDTILGKVLRYQGLFGEAFLLLQRVLDESVVDDFFEGTGWYRVLLSNTADLLSELGRHQEAQDLLQRELQPMFEKGTQDIATGQRLRISLAETFLQNSMFDDAKDLLLRLEVLQRSGKRANHSMATGSFRILISLARMFHMQSLWDPALAYWRKALENLCTSSIEQGFDAGIVRYSIAYILHITGNREQSHTFQVEAKQNIALGSRIFWIACFNSKWYDSIIQSMNKECQCCLFL